MRWSWSVTATNVIGCSEHGPKLPVLTSGHNAAARLLLRCFILCSLLSLVSSFHYGLPRRLASITESTGSRATLVAAGGNLSCKHLKLTENNGDGDSDNGGTDHSVTRREALLRSVAAVAAAATTASTLQREPSALALDPVLDERRRYTLQFPTLFDPLIGRSERETIKRPIAENIWSIEQSLILGPLETPLRCTVIKLSDNTLWVHAPLAPTQEFFELVESCGDAVSAIVVPTYALEHKVFVKAALKRWPEASLFTSPGQWSFPFRSATDTLVFGKQVDFTLHQSDDSSDDNISQPWWTDEIQYETLAAGTFDIGGVPTTLYETAFYHVSSKTLIVTDALAQVPLHPPQLNQAENLLLTSKRSTSDPMPEDTAQARQIGWEKTALLISYFFPEHEEPDPNQFGVVTWTDGWHDNFQSLAGRLVCPPVVRSLIYAQDPPSVQKWVDRVASRWTFERIVPAHWQAPIAATPEDFRKAFRFLKDDRLDSFPTKDLQRGLKPIADIALKLRS